MPPQQDVIRCGRAGDAEGIVVVAVGVVPQPSSALIVPSNRGYVPSIYRSSARVSNGTWSEKCKVTGGRGGGVSKVQ